MNTFPLTHRRWFATTTALLVLSGCSLLTPKASEHPSFYSLDGARSDSRIERAARRGGPTEAPILIVNPPRSAPGFDSSRIIYVREAHQLEYYAHSEWVDTPARMTAPLIVAAVEKSGAFRAVVLTPSTVAAELRLDTEIVRLQHELTSEPSRVHFTLRAYITDTTTRDILAWHEFDATVATRSNSPYGAVVAANEAAHVVLEQLAAFCAQAAANWQPGVDPRRKRVN